MSDQLKRQTEERDKQIPLVNVNGLSEAIGQKKSWVYTRSRETGPDAMPKYKFGKYLMFSIPEVLEWARQRAQAE
jgi:predicted DNA-binding transcriptional regulator AlpA